MTGALIKILLISCILLSQILFPVNSFSADAVKFRHIISVYTDNSGGGIKHPEGVACNEEPFFIVADTGNSRLLQYRFEEGNIKAEAEIKVPQLPYPVRIKLNSKNEIYALDGKKRRIVRLSPKGEFKGYLEPAELPSPKEFVPRSFDIDTDDNIYILDVFSERVLILDPEGIYRKHIDFPKDHGFFSDITVDFKGTILLIDSVNAKVFASDRNLNLFIPLTDSLKQYMRFPASIATDSRSRIYLVDQNDSRIIILGQDGNFLGQQLGMGWKEGLLNYPSQLCINSRGEVFIADVRNNRIQMFAVLK